MGKITLGTLLAPVVVEGRTIETITDEILGLKQQGGQVILDIGQRLIEAKNVLPHGEWLPWLTEKVEFSERTAQKFMRLSRKWSNPSTLADLGASKALMLLAIPDEERETFIEDHNVIDMSARQLEAAIKERDEARMAAEQARADARHAEESRAKMEADMVVLKQRAEVARTAEADVARLIRELEELRAAPVDVAVMAADEEQLAQARAEAVAEAEAKLDRPKKAKAKADERRKAAEEALAAANEKLAALEQAEKQAAISSDKDLATFELLFSQTQAQINQLHGLRLKLRDRGDGELAEKLARALLALAENVRRCAE